MWPPLSVTSSCCCHASAFFSGLQPRWLLTAPQQVPPQELCSCLSRPGSLPQGSASLVVLSPSSPLSRVLPLTTLSKIMGPFTLSPCFVIIIVFVFYSNSCYMKWYFYLSRKFIRVLCWFLLFVSYMKV